MKVPHKSTTPSHQETAIASAPSRYAGVAFIVGCVAAAALFTSHTVIGYALTGAFSWLSWSAIIIIANRFAQGSWLEKQIQFLHASAMEFNSSIAASILFPLTFFPQYHKAKGALTGRPILMVNGYMSFGSTWHYQKQKLSEAKLGPIYTMNIGSGKSIATYAKQVQEKVKEIQKETGRKDLILICHSKGGLVSTYFATQLAAEIQSEVTDVITIATPLSGTPIAQFGIGDDAKEMREDSSFHETLRKNIQENQHIRFFHIASTADQIVPSTSALFGDNKERQFSVNDAGHLNLVFSSRVADQICNWLKH